MSILKPIGHWISDALASLLYAWPIQLRRDFIYLWATFRLRHRPLKMLFMLIALGGLAYLWQWMGAVWGSDYLNTKFVNKLDPGKLRTTLGYTANALFSSLNFLSCVSIVIMSRSLRRLVEQDHIQHLLLTPRSIRPSALFYAIAFRYFPLAFVAILVIYLDPERTPFHRPPFEYPPANYPVPLVLNNQYEVLVAQQIGDPLNLIWAGFYELSIYFFCVTNLFMDLALSFWIMVRWRVSVIMTILAVVLIGLLSPIGLMAIQQYIRDDYMKQLQGPMIQNAEETFSFNRLMDEVSENVRVFFGGEPRDVEYESMRRPAWRHQHISGSRHYLLTGIISLLIGWVALARIDNRWRRMIGNPKRDPVFIQRLE